MQYLATSFTETTLQFIQKGGIFMWPLVICSIVGLAAVVFKIMALARSRIVPDGLVRNLRSFPQSISQEVVPSLLAGNSTLARLGAVAFQLHGRPADEISRTVEAAAREEVIKMHAGVSVLDVVITVAPLLGLLGTASGLVTIFQGLGDTNDNIIIARGIAEALNTTIFGLAIAVPCVIAQTYFIRRIEKLTARMEAAMVSFVSACSQPINPVESK
jgi:biopolymer transport protein ExbB